MSLASRLPPRSTPARSPAPRGPRPAPTPGPRGAPPGPGPPGGLRERRRRRRGRISQLLTAPLPTAAFEARLRPVARRARGALPWVAAVLGLGVAVWAVGSLWSRNGPSLAPRHRAEALCFALASPPPYAPPMTVEPSAALVRGRFTATMPPSMALRAAMQLDDRMVLSERTERIGDYDVGTAWLRLPGAETSHRWLVVGWMEGTDLAVCSFRFAGDADELTPAERQWGGRLLARILVPQNFRAGVLPPFRLRGSRDGALPVFGPKPKR
jgi:hypothetical protein